MTEININNHYHADQIIDRFERTHSWNAEKPPLVVAAYAYRDKFLTKPINGTFEKQPLTSVIDPVYSSKDQEIIRAAASLPLTKPEPTVENNSKPTVVQQRISVTTRSVTLDEHTDRLTQISKLLLEEGVTPERRQELERERGRIYHSRNANKNRKPSIRKPKTDTNVPQETQPISYKKDTVVSSDPKPLTEIEVCKVSCEIEKSTHQVVLSDLVSAIESKDYTTVMKMLNITLNININVNLNSNMQSN